MHLTLERVRFYLEAKEAFAFPSPASNKLRGVIGNSLWQRGDGSYQAFFTPSGNGGPSGLADAPRPFVLRAHHLNRRKLASGEEFHFDLHLFDLTKPWAEVLAESLGAKRVERERIDIPFAAPAEPASRVQVRFVTPTELKADGGIVTRPEFGVLAARVRDRVSTLSALYGEGPLDLDFAGFGERAAKLEITNCDLKMVAAERRSGRTGQVHSLGGFVGQVEYAGALAEFLPLLRAAEWTGVGRQTPWGKGTIAVSI